jgi:16S rRNA (cytosine1402-N4)-methyltransferase
MRNFSSLKSLKSIPTTNEHILTDKFTNPFFVKNEINYHYPVMISNITKILNNLTNIIEKFVYIDCTLGLGNHFINIYTNFKQYITKNILVDKDINSINLTIALLKQKEVISNDYIIINLNTKKENIKENNKNKFYFINDNFKNLINYKELFNKEDTLVILADLGVSMYQIKNESGFSFNSDTLLDMRYNKSQILTAYNVLNKYNQEELSNVFNKILSYKDTKRLIQAIIKYRQKQEIKTTQDLNKIISKVFSFKYLKDYLQKIYLALRIEVNNELNDLKLFLENLLKINNNFIVFIISYHSLEGKIIKNFLKSNNFKYIKEKPTKEEIKINKPSRSALLWIFANFDFNNLLLNFKN